jgi:hypothetical protein
VSIIFFQIIMQEVIYCNTLAPVILSSNIQRLINSIDLDMMFIGNDGWKKKVLMIDR